MGFLDQRLGGQVGRWLHELDVDAGFLCGVVLFPTVNNLLCTPSLTSHPAGSLLECWLWSVGREWFVWLEGLGPRQSHQSTTCLPTGVCCPLVKEERCWRSDGRNRLHCCHIMEMAMYSCESLWAEWWSCSNSCSAIGSGREMGDCGPVMTLSSSLGPGCQLQNGRWIL